MDRTSLGDIAEQIQCFTSMPICKSSFLFYSNGLVGYDTSFNEQVGFFIPHELKGYIKRDSTKNENTRRTAHEVSHGTYLENVPVGQKIVSLDMQIADAEKRVFGRLLGKGEKILVLTAMGSLGIYPLNNLTPEIRRLLPEDVDTSHYAYVAFVDDREFQDYRDLRRDYSSIVSLDIENQEGFCTLMEEHVMKTIDPVFADQLFWLNVSTDDVYGRSFRKLKAFEARYGLSGVVDYLMGGVVNERTVCRS